jgi:hypothetical protein
MSKKEVNPFNIAFLDLMSSALAAVIILFVIVPKSDIQIDIAESSFTEIKTGFEQVDSIIISWAEFMSEQEIALLLSKTDKLKAEFVQLEELTYSLQNRLNETKLRNEQLTVRLNLAEKKLQEMEKQTPKQTTPKVTTSPSSPAVQKQAQEPEKIIAAASTPQTDIPEETKTSENTARVEGKGDFLFGLNPAFVAMIQWEDSRTYVDIYLKDERGILCDSYRRKTSFGQWVKMPKKFISTPNQAIIQNDLVPGKYEVYAHLNRPRRGGNTTINGFVALNPENGNPKKIDFGDINIESGPPPYKSGGGTLLGTVEITEHDIRWIKS